MTQAVCTQPGPAADIVDKKMRGDRNSGRLFRATTLLRARKYLQRRTRGGQQSRDCQYRSLLIFNHPQDKKLEHSENGNCQGDNPGVRKDNDHHVRNETTGVPKELQ